MADNVQLNGVTQAGGQVVSTDELAGGIQVQRVKVQFGTDGNATDVNAANPLPVDTNITQPLTDAQLRAASVPVSGPLTDAQLRAAAVPISGTVSTGLTQPLTDAQLRATPVPISGTFTVSGGLTDAELRASPVGVDVTGELLEAMEAMRMAIQSLNRTIGMAQVNPLTGRMLVDPSGVTSPISGTVTANQGGTWNITNLATIGGQAANSAIPALERGAADNLRRNITVT
jgi:hypothetical protein